MVGKWTNEPWNGVDEVVNHFWVLTVAMTPSPDAPEVCEIFDISYPHMDEIEEDIQVSNIE